MKVFSVCLFLFLVIQINCKKISPSEVHSFLNKQSFLMLINGQDSLKVEFNDSCLNNYNPEYRIWDQWDIVEIEDDIILAIPFAPKLKFSSLNKHIISFTNDTINLKLIKQTQDIIDPSKLIGRWVEEKYQYLSNEPDIPPPPCFLFENDTFLIPSLEFTPDSIFLSEFCSEAKMKYTINKKLNIIEFGPYCIKEYWVIEGFRNDTLVLKVKEEIDFETRYVEKKYIYGG